MVGLQVYRKDYDGCFALSEPAKKFLRQEQPVVDNTPSITEEVRGFRFVSGTMIWLDIASSITTGEAPLLLHCHSVILAADSPIQCGDVMGCKNLIMLQIGRIAAHHEQRASALREGRLDCAHFQQDATDIMQEIWRGLAEEALGDLKLSTSNVMPTPNTMSDPQTLITHIFARMAIVYLHLVAHGFQDSEMMSKARSEAMSMIQTQIPTHLLSALVLPLFVIGTVARQEDQEFFRDILSSPPLVEPMLKHRVRLLPILEEIWRRKQGVTWPVLGWNYCLELTPDILLH
jgi:C6 transcription factor Pro1